MEGIILEPEVFTSFETAFFSLIALLLVAGVGICLGYLADEDRKGIRHYWMEEPLCDIGEFKPEEEAPEYRKAA